MQYIGKSLDQTQVDQNIQADQPMEMEEAQNWQTNETHQQNCQITLRSLTECME